MKKLILTIALVVTACNLGLGLSYAAVCEDTHGNRFCGSGCSTLPGGDCGCQGACTKDERDWVAGAGGHEEELAVLDY